VLGKIPNELVILSPSFLDLYNLTILSQAQNAGSVSPAQDSIVTSPVTESISIIVF
jgi:hypothetical protein